MSKILDSISNVYTASINSKLKESVFNEIENDLNVLSEYLKLKKKQTFLFSVFFTLIHDKDDVDMNDLISHFNCNPIQILKLNDDINYLCENQYLSKLLKSKRNDLDMQKTYYTLNEKLSDAIINKESFPETLTKDFNNIYEIIKYINNLLERVVDNQIGFFTLITRLDDIMQNYAQYDLIRKIKQLNLIYDDLAILLSLIIKTIYGSESEYLDKIMNNLFSINSIRFNKINSIIKGNCPLVKAGLIEVVKSTFINNSKIKLGEKTVRILKDSGIEIYLDSPAGDERLIQHKDIYRKTLYLNPADEKQINTLKKSFMKRKFKEIEKRMEKKKMNLGITTILHGPPGTGKTESVYQIAKHTGRDVFMIDMSENKSLWFGESEKIIKKIFNDYHEARKSSKHTPILFMNEADAVLNKRFENAEGSVSQTLNTMQNILLQEIEDFKGILICTTNLISNLDKAFERRFLYKINLNLPNKENMAKIWKLKLKSLNKKQLSELAEKYVFSGGQIDNIAKKANIFEVLYDKKPSFNDILEYCELEKFDKKENIRIGFRR